MVLLPFPTLGGFPVYIPLTSAVALIMDTEMGMASRKPRIEVLELMCMCERLILYAHMDDEQLTGEECGAIVACARRLESEIFPYCEKDQKSSAQSIHHQSA